MRNCVRSYLIFLAFILSLSGCGLAYFTDTKLLSGELKTSTGNYPITRSDQSWAIFNSSIKEGEITIIPFSNVINNYRGIVVGTIGFWLSGEAENYADFKPASAFFQINEDAKVSIKLMCYVHPTSSNGNTKITCNYPLPEILSSASYNNSSEGMRPTAKNKVEASIKDTYRFVMIFQYNEGNESIAADFKFRLKIKTRLYFGVPGGSP